MWKALVGVLFWCVAGMALGAAGGANIRTFSSTPVITAAAYADGDQIGALHKMTDVLSSSSGGIEVMSYTLLDKNKSKDAFDILFFSKQVTVTSADNAAVDVSDAEMASGFLGRVAVAAADFVDIANNSYVSKDIAKILRGDGSKHLWYLLVCKDAGGCQWGAVNDLTLRLAFYE